MKLFSATDAGQVREDNQDQIYTSDQPIGNLPNIFIVADGMGGHKAGGFASNYAVQIVLESIRKNQNFNPIKIIRQAMESANSRITKKANVDSEMKGMGTTMVVATIIGHYAYVANVGDSRLYVIDDDIHQVTKDHSLVEEMIRLGEIKREEASKHPDKNIITRALGAKEDVEIDFFDVKLEENARIILCSDGLSNMVSDQEMQEVIGGGIAEDNPAQLLVDRANKNGGKDNIAVIMIEPHVKEVSEC
jgi:Serine/threonine protein phosphatase